MAEALTNCPVCGHPADMHFDGVMPGRVFLDGMGDVLCGDLVEPQDGELSAEQLIAGRRYLFFVGKQEQGGEFDYTVTGTYQTVDDRGRIVVVRDNGFSSVFEVGRLKWAEAA